MRKFILPLLAAGGLIFSAVSLYRTHPRITPTPPPHAPPSSSYPERIAAIGLVESNTENISLGTHLSGVVEKVFVQAGQRVAAGDPLIKLDTRHLESALARAQADAGARWAEVATAKARISVAQAQAAQADDVLRMAELAGARSVSAEEITRRRRASESARAELAAAKATAEAAEASARAADASAHEIETDLARSTVQAPVAGSILKVNIRPGEYVFASPAISPWMLLGNIDPLHLRVDVDEHEAWRISPTAPAEGQVRGNANLRVRLKFVRFEPYIVPKQSLTGDANERVDTRVLQVIYAIEKGDAPLFVGQQMDVFIADESRSGQIFSLTR